MKMYLFTTQCVNVIMIVDSESHTVQISLSSRQSLELQFPDEQKPQAFNKENHVQEMHYWMERADIWFIEALKWLSAAPNHSKKHIRGHFSRPQTVNGESHTIQISLSTSY